MKMGIFFMLWMIAISLMMMGVQVQGIVEDGEVLQVHIVPHTHDDVGWLKTVDEYYIGANNTIQDARVQYILDTVVRALERNPARKFIYVEIAFFTRWWYEQDEATKASVRKLVANGQLEFVNGGWCMNDEANTQYDAMIDQMTEGHRFLYSEFQVRPTIGWQIDPFGHAAEQASLFAQFGFNAFFVGRIDYQDRALRNVSRTMEMIWRPTRSLGSATEIFTSVLYEGYDTPEGFAFEKNNVPPIQEDPRLFNVNIQQRADAFVAVLKQRSLAFATSQLMVPFGSDFQYSNAEINFKNMDRLMAYINARSTQYGVNLFYSTPSLYIQAVHEEAQKKSLAFPLKEGDDFFPYADQPYAYWTGYFTSRAGLKGFCRSRSGLLHLTETFFTSALAAHAPALSAQPQLFGLLDEFAQTVGVVQHHDAIAGTARGAVVDDYALRLQMGTDAGEQVLQAAFAQMYPRNGAAPLGFELCPYLNVSVCEPFTNTLRQNGNTAPILVLNPTAQSFVHMFAVPVPDPQVEVHDVLGNVLRSEVHATGLLAELQDEELVAWWRQNSGTPGGSSAGNYTLYFWLQLEPLSTTSVVVVSSQSQVDVVYPKWMDELGREDEAYWAISSNHYALNFSSDTGLLTQVHNLANGLSMDVSQTLRWYNASSGNNVNSSQAGGAYIFRPNTTYAYDCAPDGHPKTVVFAGTYVQEVLQLHNAWAWQRFRVAMDVEFVEQQWQIGEIDISDALGKDVVSQWNTSVSSGDRWYTDSEGQEMIARVRNWRKYWTYNMTNPVAGNYVPVNEAVFLNDSAVQFTVLPDRSEGAASLWSGGLELMGHRRLLHDDGRGLGSPMNSTETVLLTHRLLLLPPEQSMAAQRLQGQRVGLAPLLMFAEFQGSENDFRNNYDTQWAVLNSTLPENVRLLNLRPLEVDANGRVSVLLRLSHIFAVDEDPVLSQPVSIPLRELFHAMTPVDLHEYSLSANTPIEDVHRLQWIVAGEEFAHNESRDFWWKQVPKWEDQYSILLHPLEIRTFMVTFQKSE